MLWFAGFIPAAFATILGLLCLPDLSHGAGIALHGISLGSLSKGFLLVCVQWIIGISSIPAPTRPSKSRLCWTFIIVPVVAVQECMDSNYRIYQLWKTWDLFVVVLLEQRMRKLSLMPNQSKNSLAWMASSWSSLEHAKRKSSKLSSLSQWFWSIWMAQAQLSNFWMHWYWQQTIEGVRTWIKSESCLVSWQYPRQHEGLVWHRKQCPAPGLDCHWLPGLSDRPISPTNPGHFWILGQIPKEAPFCCLDFQHAQDAFDDDDPCDYQWQFNGSNQESFTGKWGASLDRV
jgi:hypothetical protein